MRGCEYAKHVPVLFKIVHYGIHGIITASPPKRANPVRALPHVVIGEDLGEHEWHPHLVPERLLTGGLPLFIFRERLI